MAQTNRTFASKRMTERNPMRKESVREKVSSTLREMGWKPTVRCGNGTITEPQLLLASALGWEMEVPVRTGMGRSSGYPSCYKVDIGNTELKIAVEVDGNSHHVISRRQEDAKKDALLASLGWSVLRFWNAEVMEELEKCVRTVMSTTLKLKNITTTLPTAFSSTTVITPPLILTSV
jgi:hypothetical protein